jgi:endonuclease/exonuclease/phosphatase (EEP) superfamily protein YafD
MRKKQFDEIAKIVKTNSNFIIAGDFNTPDFAEFNVLDNNAAKKTYTLNRTNHMKYTEPASKSAIDNIVFRNWTFGKPQVVTNSYSDHYMLWGEATFNG